jgi:hypothetical protein
VNDLFERIDSMMPEVISGHGQTILNFAGSFVLLLVLAFVRHIVLGYKHRTPRAFGTKARRLIEALKDAPVENCRVFSYGKNWMFQAEHKYVRVLSDQGCYLTVSDKLLGIVTLSNRPSIDMDNREGNDARLVTGLTKSEQKAVRQAARDLIARVGERSGEDHEIAVQGYLNRL